MTETSADWVERPKPADVAALSTTPVPRPAARRERVASRSSLTQDPRVTGGAVAAAALVVALVLLRRRTRR